MKNGEQPAFSHNLKKITPDANMQQGGYGLTKREYFAAMAMQGIMGNLNCAPITEVQFFNIAEDSIRIADELLKQLEQ